MTDDNRKPSTEELYAVAISNGTGHLDMILAAGLQRHILGAQLLRLRVEYDQVRAGLERAGQIAPSAQQAVSAMRRDIDRLKARAATLGASRDADQRAEANELLRKAADKAAELEAVDRRTPAEVQSARAFVLLGLSTLAEAKREIGALALRMGTKRNMPTEVTMRLAGRVLDVWLDETCHRCDGTGLLGSRYQGDTVRQCTTCKGTGHRRDILGDSLQQTRFAGDLLAEIQRQVAAAAAGIKAARISTQAPGRQLHPDLARRLAELRGEAAAAD